MTGSVSASGIGPQDQNEEQRTDDKGKRSISIDIESTAVSIVSGKIASPVHPVHKDIPTLQHEPQSQVLAEIPQNVRHDAKSAIPVVDPRNPPSETELAGIISDRAVKTLKENNLDPGRKVLLKEMAGIKVATKEEMEGPEAQTRTTPGAQLATDIKRRTLIIGNKIYSQKLFNDMSPVMVYIYTKQTIKNHVKELNPSLTISREVGDEILYATVQQATVSAYGALEKKVQGTGPEKSWRPTNQSPFISSYKMEETTFFKPTVLEITVKQELDFKNIDDDTQVQHASYSVTSKYDLETNKVKFECKYSLDEDEEKWETKNPFKE